LCCDKASFLDFRFQAWADEANPQFHGWDIADNAQEIRPHFQQDIEETGSGEKNEMDS
jgi:hypothetical protein